MEMKNTKETGPQGQVEEQDKALREAAIRRAKSHQGVVEANSDTLTQAAMTLIGLDADPRALDRWFAAENDKPESEPA
jgi:hypothetical protein